MSSRISGFVALSVFLPIGLAVSLILLGPLLKSKIGLVDENDIAFYLGNAGSLKLSEIFPTLITKTNVFSFGDSAIVRPLYYVDRIIETALWGTNASYWYGVRIGFFGVVIGVMAWLYVRYVGLLLGVALTVYSLSFAMWADIWARSAGVSEQLTSFGLALVVVGVVLFFDRWRQNSRLRTAILLVSVGALIAMGSKENMLPLMALLAALLLYGLRHRRLGTIEVIALLAALGMGAWVAASVVAYLIFGNGVDLYGNTPSLTKALSSRLMLIFYGIFCLVALVATLTNTIIKKCVGEAAARAHQASAMRLLFGILILIVIIASQQTFYISQLPARQRYDFPGLLCFPALIVLFVISLRETISAVYPSHASKGYLLDGATAAALIVYTCFVTWRLPPAVAANVARNTAFDSALNATARVASTNPDWPIVVRSYSPWDFELVQSLGLWLIAKGVGNPRFLVYIEPSSQQTTFEKKELSGMLIAQSQNGYLQRGYRPLSQFAEASQSKCFVIAFKRREAFADERTMPPASPGLACADLPMSISMEGGALVVRSPD